MRVFTNLATAFTLSLLSLTLMPLAQASDLEFSHIKGYDFSLGDVQKQCKAHRHSGNALEIKCKLSNMRAVSRNCEGYITGGLSDVSFSCRGNLRIVSNKCRVKMLGAQEGEMSCSF